MSRPIVVPPPDDPMRPLHGIPTWVGSDPAKARAVNDLVVDVCVSRSLATVVLPFARHHRWQSAALAHVAALDPEGFGRVCGAIPDACIATDARFHAAVMLGAIALSGGMPMRNLHGFAAIMARERSIEAATALAMTGGGMRAPPGRTMFSALVVDHVIGMDDRRGAIVLPALMRGVGHDHLLTWVSGSLRAVARLSSKARD